MLKDGDLLYYKYPDGSTMIVGYFSEYDGKNILLENLSSYYCLYKVVRDKKIIWKRDSNIIS